MNIYIWENKVLLFDVDFRRLDYDFFWVFFYLG